MKTGRIFMTVVAVALGGGLSAKEKVDFARVSFSSRSASTQRVSPDQFIVLVIDGPNVSFAAKPIPAAEVVDFVNGLLKARGVSGIGVYVREGSKYGEVVRAIDLLRQTEAKSIGVSTSELPAGREI